MSGEPYILALILARAGSKGVPGKNVMTIAGKPLIAHSIQQALDSKHISRVIVSTDGADIADISRDYGAEVPFVRPDELARDLSPDIDAFRHALEYLRDAEARLPELVVHLRPTGPVRRVDLIDQAIAKMLAHPAATALRSVTLASQTPYKMWLLDGDYLSPAAEMPGESEAHSMARQFLPKAYWQNGYVDIVRPSTVLDQGSMVGARPLAFVVDEGEFEIDYPEDVSKVEAALRRLQEGGEAAVPKDRRHANRFPV